MKPHFSVQRSKTSAYRPQKETEEEVKEGEKMDKVEEKEDKRPVCVCVWVCGVRIYL